MTDAPLVTVAPTMATHHVHCVIVAGIATDATGADHPTGVVSSLDIAGALAWGRT